MKYSCVVGKKLYYTIMTIEKAILSFLSFFVIIVFLKWWMWLGKKEHTEDEKVPLVVELWRILYGHFRQ